MGTGMSLGQFGYMHEQEVDNPAAFNAALKQMRKDLAWAKGLDIMLTDEVNDILWQHGIDPHTLTKAQVRRIEAAIE